MKQLYLYPENLFYNVNTRLKSVKWYHVILMLKFTFVFNSA